MRREIHYLTVMTAVIDGVALLMAWHVIATTTNLFMLGLIMASAAVVSIFRLMFNRRLVIIDVALTLFYLCCIASGFWFACDEGDVEDLGGMIIMVSFISMVRLMLYYVTIEED